MMGFRSARRCVAAVSLTVVTIAALGAGAAWSTNNFTDIGNTGGHINNIDAIYNAGITLGCNQAGDNYCPDNPVTRAQMASFLARGLGLSSGTTKNLPKANGRGDLQAYCALVAANPGSFRSAPCLAVSRRSIDGGNQAGQAVSLTIGMDGLPIMSYYDGTTNHLKVAHCVDAACLTTPTVTTVDSANFVGFPSSIAIGADGLPVIAYEDATNQALKTARCSRIDCTGTATLSTQQGTGSVGQSIALAVDAAQRPIIAYVSAGTLKVARCEFADCSGNAVVNTVDAPGGASVGVFPSIAIGVDGLPILTYQDATNKDLKVAHCGADDCGSVTVTTLESTGSVGWYTSVTIGVDGLAIISEYDNTAGSLKVLHCADTACTSTTSVTTVDNTQSSMGQYSSIAIGADGFPIVSYSRGSGVTRFAKCGNVACTVAPTLTSLDGLSPSTYTAVALGADRLPIVAYYVGALFFARPSVS